MIDFAAIAARFADGFVVQTHGWATIFDHMEKLLDSLREQSEAAERITRGYPVLRFRDDALGVRLALGPAEAPFGAVDGTGRALGQGLADGARRFVGGFGFVGDAVTQELATGRMLADLGAMAGVVDAALGRFDTARPEMFDAHRFSDVFGLAALGWRALQGEQDQLQLRRFAFRAGATAEFLRTFPGDTPASGDPAAPGGIGATVGRLEDVAGLALAGVLLLPAAGLALEVALTDGVLAAKGGLLRALQGVETQVDDLRAAIVDGWLTAFDAGTTAAYLARAATLVAGADDVLFTTAVPLWVTGLELGVEGLVLGLQSWVDWVDGLLRTLPPALDDLMAVDLLPWVLQNTIGRSDLPVVPIPTVTLGDVAKFAAGEGSERLHDAIDRVLSVYSKYLWTRGLVSSDYDKKHEHIVALREVLDRVLAPTPFWWPPDAPPSGPLAGFPDAYEAFFGGTRRADLLAAVSGLGTQLQGTVHDLGTAGAGLAAGLAGSAEDEMARQARAGAGLTLGARWRGEGALVTDLFGPLRGDVANAAGPPDPLAQAFEDAAGGGGIVTAAQAVPAYVGELRRYWSTRSERREYPTSAHLLARRGRLAMVRVPRLTIDAPDRAPDAALAGQVADRFQGVVVGAYREGRARMAALAAPPQGGAGRGRG